MQPDVPYVGMCQMASVGQDGEREPEVCSHGFKVAVAFRRFQVVEKQKVFARTQAVAQFGEIEINAVFVRDFLSDSKCFPLSFLIQPCLHCFIVAASFIFYLRDKQKKGYCKPGVGEAGLEVRFLVHQVVPVKNQFSRPEGVGGGRKACRDNVVYIVIRAAFGFCFVGVFYKFVKSVSQWCFIVYIINHGFKFLTVRYFNKVHNKKRTCSLHILIRITCLHLKNEDMHLRTLECFGSPKISPAPSALGALNLFCRRGVHQIKEHDNIHFQP